MVPSIPQPVDEAAPRRQALLDQMDIRHLLKPLSQSKLEAKPAMQ